MQLQVVYGRGFLPADRGHELGMDGQLDGRAIAHALRGLVEAAPVPGDLSAVLQQLVDTAKTVLAADGVGLMLTDEEDGRLRSTASTDTAAELLAQVQEDLGEGPCLTTYGSGEPVAVTDLGADPRWIRLAAVVGQVSVRAVAAVPVRLAGVVVGSLSAYAATARAWSPEELGGLEALAELAAGVVQGGVRLDASQSEVGQLRHALTSRVLIEQAKGVLVARDGLDPEAAFQRLRRQARSTARPMADVAGEVIAQAGRANTAAQARAAAGSARRLAELEQVAAGFAAARTSTTVARLVVDRGLRALDAQAGLIGLNSADGQALELVAWAGYPVQTVTPWRRIPLEAPTPLTEVAHNGGAIWVSSTEEFQARYPAVPKVVEHQAHVAIGLVVEGRPAGALGFSFTRARSFNEVDRRFVQALASHCAQALERVWLAEQARVARTKLASAQARALSAERAALAAQANAQRAREQAGYLAEVSAMLASPTDLEAVLEQMAWLAVPRLGDWCQLHLQHPDGGTRYHTIAHSDPSDAPVLARLTDRGPIDLTGAHLAAPAGQGDQAPLVDQLDPVFLHRIARDADHLELLTALNLGSVMVVPLTGRTRILGTITLASHQPGRYSEADLTLAQNLARRTATAIEHADRARHPDPPTPSPSPRPTAD